MPEILLHYIWQQRLWADTPQATTEGVAVEILSVGQHNRDAGPDFSHAHLRIGTQEWVGNVEMHKRASAVFLPGESQGQGSLVGCRLWGCKVRHD